MKNRIADALNNAPLRPTAEASIAVIDRLQNHWRNPGVQVAAAAATFLLLCERFGVDAQDAFTATKNLMNEADSKMRPEFAAVRAYLRHEVR